MIILKRSLKPGFAGEDNELFYDPKTMMVFGDAKATLTKLAQAAEEVKRRAGRSKKASRRRKPPG